MALNGDRLGDAMRAAIDAVGDKTDRTALFRALGQCVVDEFVQFAQVTTVVSVASVSGVTVGPGVSGPGAGTGTGTIL